MQSKLALPLDQADDFEWPQKPLEKQQDKNLSARQEVDIVRGRQDQEVRGGEGLHLRQRSNFI